MKDFTRAIRVLEFDKIIEKLKTYAASDLGRDEIDKLEISNDIDEISRMQEETAEAVNLIVKKSHPPLFGINSMKDYVKRAELGGSLTPGNLIKVSDSLRVARYLKGYLNDNEEISAPTIEGLIGSLFSYKKLEDEINSAILSEDEISDNASPKLSTIRRSIKNKKDSIRSKLSSIVSSDDSKKYLQDQLVTMREGRYVVPVKQENKGKIKGLIHDVSSSGQTVYIEPMAVVNLNNELKELYGSEREEIERILADLSNKVAEFGLELNSNEEVLKKLDFIFSKGSLALEQNAHKPRINSNRYIDLVQARHPLLKVSHVVPIDFSLGDGYTSLIITGPNTGGKTVSIKTVGLMVLMHQAGLHIPVAESSTLGIFSSVYADIGDEQSIEQSLSTFSSHMVNIVSILEKADRNSLVIFDELGAGTDPTEGAALAQAIMDNMRKKDIRTIATTHYNQLKIYALTEEGVANASMEFDINTLSPTFRLLIGVPGKSNAFEISKRLGLSNELIKNAQEYVTKESVDFETVLQSIENDRSILEENRRESTLEREELQRERERLQREIDKTIRMRDSQIEKSKDEAKRILLQAKEEAELAISEIREVKKDLDSKNARKIQDANDMLRTGLDSVRKKKDGLVIEKAKNPVGEIVVGQSVEVSTLGVKGTVLELPDSSGNVLVQVGLMKMNIPKASLIAAEEEEVGEKSSTKSIIRNKAKNVSSEIDIRGKNFEEATIIIDKYLDDAYISGLKSVRIIHGKGTGVLRDKLRPYLKRIKFVKKVREADYDDGGSGVTYVDIK